MDPVTHGIAGALLGKGYFSERHGRVATFAATVGAVFPDVDVFCDVFSRDPLAIAKYHRGFTHSFLGLPVFAAALAWLTRWYVRRRGGESPSWAVLTLIYGVGIASHILLDSMTSFGTRIWNPISSDRVAWDTLFIVDVAFTAILLLPQIAAWVFGEETHASRRAAAMWAAFSAAAVVVWWLVAAAGFPFHAWALAVWSGLMAALFFLPRARHWGFGVRRSSWCRAGVYVALAYIAAAAVAHHAALQRVETFAAEHHISAARLGALPLPPSPLDWNGLILTPEGVYVSGFDLRDAQGPAFQFAADSPANRFIAEAEQAPDVKTYLWFARFPAVTYSGRGAQNRVEFADFRFFSRRVERPMPFTYLVVFDSAGKLLEQGWLHRPPRFRWGHARSVEEAPGKK